MVGERATKAAHPLPRSNSGKKKALGFGAPLGGRWEGF